VLSAAYRELKEETGLTDIHLRLVGTIVVDVEQETGIAIYVFRGEAGEMMPCQSPEGTLEWVKVEQFIDIPLVEDLPALLPRVLNSSPGSPVFFGIYRYNSENKMEIKFRSEGRPK